MSTQFQFYSILTWQAMYTNNLIIYVLFLIIYTQQINVNIWLEKEVLN
jgi:hypothetical protein